MTTLLLVVIVAVTCFTYSSTAFVLPSWLTPCKGTDPNLSQCSEKEANRIMPIIVKGYPPLSVPPLEPLNVPEIKIQFNGQLNIVLRDVFIHGLGKTKPFDFKNDFKKQTIDFKLSIPKLVILSKYEIDGRILVLPLTGKGPGNITAVDGIYVIKLSYSLHDKKGIQYAKIDQVDVSFELQGLHVRFDNLFNGNKELGDAANAALNKDWRVILTELEPAIKDTIAKIALLLANSVLTKVPFADIFAGELP